MPDHTATKTREMGRVSGYERAGITRVQVRAHLDERTTDIKRDRAYHSRRRALEYTFDMSFDFEVAVKQFAVLGE